MDEQVKKTYWEKFINDTDVRDAHLSSTYAFGNSKEMADNLAELVNSGIKTATSSAFGLYNDHEYLPQVGDYNLILDGSDRPVCITQTVVSEVVPFDEVSHEHAYHEGEGNRSYDYWRKVHLAFFKQEYQKEHLLFNEKIPCLCEVFKVVYRF